MGVDETQHQHVVRGGPVYLMEPRGLRIQFAWSRTATALAVGRDPRSCLASEEDRGLVVPLVKPPMARTSPARDHEKSRPLLPNTLGTRGSSTLQL